MKGAVDRSIKQTKRFHKFVERERKSVDNSQTESARFTMEDRRIRNDRGTNTSVIVISNRTTPTKSIQTVYEFYTDPISHQILLFPPPPCTSLLFIYTQGTIYCGR